jgi:hypothetical protein
VEKTDNHPAFRANAALIQDLVSVWVRRCDDPEEAEAEGEDDLNRTMPTGRPIRCSVLLLASWREELLSLTRCSRLDRDCEDGPAPAMLDSFMDV